MRYHEPATLDEALALLADEEDARCLAGGATLVAMMNAQLVEPSALVSLRKLDDLKRIARADDGAVSIGAMTTHKRVAASDQLTGGHAVVRDAARLIGHPAIRNMGTIGGSISHGDAAADYPAALVAADATVSIAGKAGSRDVPIGEFFVDFLETAIEPGELVTEVRLPPPAQGSVGVYEKFARVEGDFATVSVAVVLSMRDGACERIRVSLGGCGPVPVRSDAADERLTGSSLSEDDVAHASEALVAACDPVDDFRGSAEYRLMLVPTLLRRAIESAKTKVTETP